MNRAGTEQDMAFHEIIPDVLPRLLENLGCSLPAACSTSRSLAHASESNDGACFKPLSGFHAAPSANASKDWCCTSENRERRRRFHHVEVARARQDPAVRRSWRSLARAVHRLDDLPSLWWMPEVHPHKDSVSTPGLPSNRHSLAVCGVPGREAALLFGGNVSRRMEGTGWRSSAELFMAELPTGTAERAVRLWELPKPRGDCVWPCSRWGASLTALQSAAYLHGGWSEVQRTDQVWALRLREAEAAWSVCENRGTAAPLSTAFHSASALEDGKCMVLYGGLASSRSQKGVWMWEADKERWSVAHIGGPVCAGHAAAVVGSRLVLYGGVDRSKLQKDAPARGASVFDLRAGKWDMDFPMRLRRSGPGPTPRRNSLCCSVGKYMIISGGFDCKLGKPLGDTWALDVPGACWKKLPGCDESSPALEGHKPVVSGMDVFAFGGLSGPETPRSRSLPVHALNLGGCGGLAMPETETEAEGLEKEEEGEQEEEEFEATDMEATMLRLQQW